MYIVKNANLIKLENYGFNPVVYEYYQKGDHAIYRKDFYLIDDIKFKGNNVIKYRDSYVNLLGIRFEVSKEGIFSYSLITKYASYITLQTVNYFPHFSVEMQMKRDLSPDMISKMYLFTLYNNKNYKMKNNGISINIKDYFIDLITSNIISEYDNYTDFIYSNII